MIRILYTAGFVRDYKKLPLTLQEEASVRIEMFRVNPRNPLLRLHKLKGPLRGYMSFSVNYRYRIVVEEDAKNVFALLAVGDHSVYE